MAYNGCGKIIYDNKNITDYVYDSLGERCVTPSIIIPTAIIYGFILLLGVLGNICTCIVIVKNKSMQTPTNYYLFSLAISDLLVLILGLPMELYGVFDAVYPYHFGEFVCKLRAFLIEFTSYASILTITCFSIERWLAICFPLRIKMFSTLHRAIRVIIAVWVIAFLAATPVMHIVVINKLDLPEEAMNQSWTFMVSKDGRTVDRTEYCAMDITRPHEQKMLIYTAFFVFFLLPAILISLVYCHIVLKLRSVDHLITEPSNLSIKKKNKSRQSLLKVLVSVVVMFFLCWLPFHIQRLLSIFLTEYHETEQGSPAVHYLFNIVFYISGYCYYSNSACNPILYNILSEKYRIAFCRTIFGERIATKIFNIKNQNLMMHSCMSASYYPNRPPTGRSKSSNHLLKPGSTCISPTSPTRSPSRAASITVTKKDQHAAIVGRLSPVRHFSDTSVNKQSHNTLTPLLVAPCEKMIQEKYCIDYDEL